MKLSSKDKKTFLRYIKTPAVLLFWLAVWQLLSKITGSELLVPSPHSVFNAFVSLASEKEFYISCIGSLTKILLGWALGTLFGLVLGIMTSVSGIAKAVFSPLLYVVKATPVASFIILALVLMSAGAVPVFTCFLITVPFVWSNSSQGIASPDEKLLECARFFGMSTAQKIRSIYIPAVLPYFVSAAKTTLGLAWKAGIAAEVICSPKNSIGAGIYEAKIYLETPNLFAWTLTVIVLSVAFEKILGLFLKKSGGAK